MYKTFFFLKVRGLENVPLDEAVILASNHQSCLDATLSCIFLKNRFHVMARKSLFHKNKLFAKACFYVGAFPIDRDADFKGSSAFKKVFQIIKDKEILVIYPESTRSPDGKIHEFMPGLARIALMTGTTVVPSTINGAYKAWPKGKTFPNLFKKITVTYHKPIYVEKCKDKAILEQKIEELNKQLKQVVEQGLDS